MKYYLWVVLCALDVERFVVTSDPQPTHSDAETWVLVKEFYL